MRNIATRVNRSLRNINEIIGSYKKADLLKDLNECSPKERIEFILKFINVVIDNKELLKTDIQIAKESEIIISFFDKE